MPATLRVVRSPVRVEVTESAWDELHIDLTVSRAERAIFARAVATHVRTALVRLAQPQPDSDGAERVLVALDRLTAQEERRVRAEDEPEPIQMALAA